MFTKIPVSQEIQAQIFAIASKVRKEAEDFVEGDLEQLNNTCHFMSRDLCQALVEAGFNAIRVAGYYMNADEDFEPDMSEWDEEAIDNHNPCDGYSHWWVEVEGLIVDICADQFHPSCRVDYAVEILHVDSCDYQCLK